ncbi:MAG: phenylalanine--tRNA ligase subunit beta [Bacteroidales bacterium]|nr:phenylalanine--tRNA ligase subunit beta [Bacteroidales bacterium]MDD4670369.1 phenylalanine--tRNA ligase subunit beta [Bacteroidales bacterium]
MVVSYNWLKDYLNFDLQPEEVGRILTSTGLEVEHTEQVEQIPGGLSGVIVAQVVECVPHPDSDHLHVTKLNTGEPELLQVVCGAPNVAAGQKVLLATIGTKLPTSDGSEFKIKKSKIRGVESNGMICAEDELGIGTSHEGIMVLEDSAVPGTAAKDYLKLSTDTIFEIGLTPNRIDGASHIGAVRDLYAYLKLHDIPVEYTLPSVADYHEGDGEAIPVTVLAPDLAPRYIGITIKNVKVGPSPDWLKERLQSIGQRPINNIVDITNFVLNEMGHPLHAFDASKIEGREVIVRRSTPDCKFVTLDGVERTLSSEDLVICNKKEPMCIAGVFGGATSGVTESTTEVFLESAYFNPVSIRKTSKRHGIKTDASFRYERGIDPLNTMYAAKRAALLIQEIAGGEIVGNMQEFYPQKFEKAVVELNYARMESLIGKKIGGSTIKNILSYMDFDFITDDSEGCTVAVPSYRVDVTRECDVVEDVLRIYGYNNIELPTSMRVSINASEHPDPETVRSTVSNFFANNGFMEMMNNSLTKSDYYANLKSYPADNLVMIINPLSQDLNCMRQTLLLNALEVVSHNINHQCNDLKLFELGNVYSYRTKEGDEYPASNLKSYKEEMRLSIVISGPGSKAWRNELCSGHYFALKGYLELLLKRFGANLYDLEYAAAPSDLFSEGLEYRLQGKTLAVAGTIAPARLKQFDIKQPVFAAEVNWPVFYELVKRDKVKYKELPKYPEVKRDLALLLDENVSFAELRKCAFQTEKNILKNVTLFDVYRGIKIPAGKKQYALNFVLQNPEQTLTDVAVEHTMDKLLKSFESKFGATLR